MAKHDDTPRHDDPTEIEPRPAPPPDYVPNPNVAHLKQDIAGGATGDKIPMLDPAAAPLGTDDEAAGTPPTWREVAEARAAERATSRGLERPADRGEDRHRLRLIGALLALVALGAAALWLSHG